MVIGEGIQNALKSIALEERHMCRQALCEDDIDLQLLRLMDGDRDELPSHTAPAEGRSDDDAAELRWVVRLQLCSLNSVVADCLKNRQRVGPFDAQPCFLIDSPA